MRDFRVEPIAQIEFEDAAVWYEVQRSGLGSEFIAEVERVLRRIASQERFPTAPIASIEGGVVRREFVDRFPYIVVFVESPEHRRVIMIRRGSANPETWKSRL